MYDFSYPLGNAVKSTRYQRGLTQLQVADMADIDVRTVMNIENYKANPKMEVLYPLVRALRIDARTIFTPELQRESPALQQLRTEPAVPFIREKQALCFKHLARRSIPSSVLPH